MLCGPTQLFRPVSSIELIGESLQFFDSEQGIALPEASVVVLSIPNTLPAKSKGKDALLLGLL